MLVACRHGSAPQSSPPTCEATAEHVRTLLGRDDQHAHDIRQVFATRCRDDRWSADVRACMVSTESFKDPKHCKARLTIAQRSHLDADLQSAAAAQRARRYPAPCVLYQEIVEKLALCDKFPQEARDAMRQGLEAFKGSWTELDDPKRYEDVTHACKTAAEALRQGATSLGCPL
jgi:hypothetical protein